MKMDLMINNAVRPLTVGHVVPLTVGDDYDSASPNYNAFHCWKCGGYHYGECFQSSGTVTITPTITPTSAQTFCSGKLHYFDCEHVATCQCGKMKRTPAEGA